MEQVHSRKQKNKYTLGYILRHYISAYTKFKKLTQHQWKTVCAIIKCRTPALGGKHYKCNTCGHEVKVYHSCRDRHCPQCQNIKQKKWVMQQQAKLLPVPYFHAVFTVPEELNNIFLYNKALMYDILFKSVVQTIGTFARMEFNGDIGMTTILHTWTQTLLYHPHLHIIVPGGALHISEKRWIRSKSEDFLFPVHAMAAMYKAKFLSEIRKVHKNKDLQCIDILKKYESKYAFNNFLNDLFNKKWVVYCKRGFGGPKDVLKYLGRYTHKVAISNGRIKDVSNNEVTFKYIDRKDNNTKKEMSLSVYEFIRRFLQHILPYRYVRIRHYGLNTSMQKEKRLIARRLLHVKEPEDIKITTEMILKELKIDHKRCTECENGIMTEIADIPRQNSPPEKQAANPIQMN